MKKIKWLIAFCVLCMVMAMTGCNTTGNADEKITIVCTNFPLYDWTRNLLGSSETEVILLLDNGTDMHSFQPSAEEMIQIADCDMLVHVGGESDAWLMEALESTPNENRVIVNLMEVLEEDVRAEQYAEGMQTSHVHADGSECEEEHEHGEGTIDGADEHVWLSLRLAVKACEAIEEVLCTLLPEEAMVIQANAKTYCNELEALDQKYADMVANSSPDSKIIVADRFPFLYMMEDYALEYCAAFPGCSTEAEADFETVVYLAEEVEEHQATLLLITESGTDALANTIFENIEKTGDTAVLHSIQVVYQSDIDAGASYLDYMEENLEVLKQVLQ